MSLSYMGSVSAKNIEFLSELTHQNRKHETFCSVSFAPFSEIYFKNPLAELKCSYNDI